MPVKNPKKKIVDSKDNLVFLHSIVVKEELDIVTDPDNPNIEGNSASENNQEKMEKKIQKKQDNFQEIIDATEQSIEDKRSRESFKSNAKTFLEKNLERTRKALEQEQEEKDKGNHIGPSR